MRAGGERGRSARHTLPCYETIEHGIEGDTRLEDGWQHFTRFHLLLTTDHALPSRERTKEVSPSPGARGSRGAVPYG